jgi:hypothetical protein
MPEIVKLTAQAAELKQEVAALRAAVSRFEPRIERAERVSVRTAVASVIVLILVISVGYVGYRNIVTDKRIDGLCPILALVVGSADPNTRAAGPDRDQYVQALDVMRKAYSDLGCTTPFVPPRRQEGTSG